jgi:hypothetical protein
MRSCGIELAPCSASGEDGWPLGDEGGGGLAVTALVSIYMIVGRLNDLDRSPWWCLVLLVPGINLVLSLYLCVERSVGRAVAVV